MKIEFQPRWKEMLDGKLGEKKFTVELSMGRLHTYFPTQEIWKREAPEWAAGLWDTAQEQARIWCEENKIPFDIDEHTWVEFSDVTVD